VGRGRTRCGGKAKGHGNLLECTDRCTYLLDQDPSRAPTCSCNASRRNEETFCTAWNVVTHATHLKLSFLFCSKQNRSKSQDGDLLRPSGPRPPAGFLALSLRESRKIIGKAYSPRHGGAILETRIVTGEKAIDCSVVKPR
jgi:hypothetical protein